MTAPTIIQSSLIKTLDKAETLATLRQWRYDSTNSVEIEVITDFMRLINTGDLDG